MRIYLARHEEAEPGEPDSERALTARGQHRGAKLAHQLAPELGLERIVCSPLKRAQQTAALHAEASGAPVQIAHELAYPPSLEALVTLLGTGPGTLFIGHEPILGQLLAHLLGRPPLSCSFRVGMIVALQLEPHGSQLIARWSADGVRALGLDD